MASFLHNSIVHCQANQTENGMEWIQQAENKWYIKQFCKAKKRETQLTLFVIETDNLTRIFTTLRYKN